MSDRHEQLLIDATLNRPTPGLTPAEAKTKRALQREVRAIKRHGGIVDIPADIPAAGEARKEEKKK